MADPGAGAQEQMRIYTHSGVGGTEVSDRTACQCFQPQHQMRAAQRLSPGGSRADPGAGPQDNARRPVLCWSRCQCSMAPICVVSRGAGCGASPLADPGAGAQEQMQTYGFWWNRGQRSWRLSVLSAAVLDAGCTETRLR